MFGGYLTYSDFFSFKITLPPTLLTTQTRTVVTFGKLECGRYDLNKNYNYSTMLNISHDMVARKLVKFNSGLSQIFIKVLKTGAYKIFSSVYSKIHILIY